MRVDCPAKNRVRWVERSEPHHDLHRCSALAAMVLIVCAAVPSWAGESPAVKPAAKSSKKPRVLVTIAKETTYVTGPLRKDGYVDYVVALNQRQSQGVTPENNAAVLFWKAMGPGEVSKPNREQFFKLLGIPPLAEQGDYVVPLGTYAKGHNAAAKAAPGGPEKQASNEAGKQEIEAGTRPWSKSEFPLIAGWLAANERPLALLTEAFQRPRRYDPLVCDEKASIIVALLPAVQSQREAARMLVARAMLRLGEGKVDAAWEDLLSCHRQARLVGQGPTLIDALVAVAIDGIACSADQALLRTVRLTPTQAAKMCEDLGELPPMSTMAESIDGAERFLYLDAVSLAARDGLASTLGGLLDGGEPAEIVKSLKSLANLAAGVAVDWDEILRLGNSWYDRMADAFRKPTRAERTAAFDKINGDIRKLSQKSKDIASLAISMLGNPRRAVSRRIGETLIALLLPAVSAAADAEDRAAMQFELIRIGFALAAYRADHSSYPAKLADLVPKYVARLPEDLFIAAELHYQRDGEGYLLYSVGVNGKDDGAKGYEDRGASGADWDDLVVRVPAAKPARVD